MALWLQSNCDCEVIEGLISQKRSDCNQREGEEKTRAQRRPVEGNQSRQARKKKKERRKFYSNMQVEVKLILQSSNAFIETLPQLLIGIPIPPTFNVLWLFLFCKNFRGGGSIENDCTTALRCCLETWQLMCEIWDGKQVFDKLLWATSCFSNVSILRRETWQRGKLHLVQLTVIPENPLSVLRPLLFTSTSSWSHVAPPHDATSPYGAFIIYHVYISYYLSIIYSHQIT